MGKKKVTEQAVKQMKEKVDMLWKKAEKGGRRPTSTSCPAWIITCKKKRHKPKEFAALRRKLPTTVTGVWGGTPLHYFTVIGYPKGSVPAKTSKRKEMAKKKPKKGTATTKDTEA